MHAVNSNAENDRNLSLSLVKLVFYKLTKLVSEELAKLDFEKVVLVHVVEL